MDRFLSILLFFLLGYLASAQVLEYPKENNFRTCQVARDSAQYDIERNQMKYFVSTDGIWNQERFNLFDSLASSMYDLNVIFNTFQYSSCYNKYVRSYIDEKLQLDTSFGILLQLEYERLVEERSY